MLESAFEKPWLEIGEGIKSVTFRFHEWFHGLRWFFKITWLCYIIYIYIYMLDGPLGSQSPYHIYIYRYINIWNICHQTNLQDVCSLHMQCILEIYDICVTQVHSSNHTRPLTWPAQSTTTPDPWHSHLRTQSACQTYSSQLQNSDQHHTETNKNMDPKKNI